MDANGDFYGREQTARQVFALPVTTTAPAAAANWRSALAAVTRVSR
jgi:hypothetical protein